MAAGATWRRKQSVRRLEPAPPLPFGPPPLPLRSAAAACPPGSSLAPPVPVLLPPTPVAPPLPDAPEPPLPAGGEPRRAITCISLVEQATIATRAAPVARPAMMNARCRQGERPWERSSGRADSSRAARERRENASAQVHHFAKRSAENLSHSLEALLHRIERDLDGSTSRARSALSIRTSAERHGRGRSATGREHAVSRRRRSRPRATPMTVSGARRRAVRFTLLEDECRGVPQVDVGRACSAPSGRLRPRSALLARARPRSAHQCSRRCASALCARED